MYEADCAYKGVKAVEFMEPQKRMSDYRRDWHDKCTEVYNRIMPFKKKIQEEK